MKRFVQFFTLIQIPLDYLMVWAAFLSAYQLRTHWEILPVIYVQPLAEFLLFSAYISAIWSLVLTLSGAYRFRGFSTFWDLIGKLIVASTVALAFFVILLFFTKTVFFSRFIILAVWGIGISYLIIGRYILSLCKQWLQHYGAGVERIVIIGSGTTADHIAEIIRSNAPSQKLVATYSQIDATKLQEIKPDKLIIVSQVDNNSFTLLLRICEDLGTTFQYIPAVTSDYHSQTAIQMLGQYPVIELSATPLNGWGRVVKRIFDIVLAIVGIIILSPVLLILALVIKLTSKGPVLFAQTRIGELGRPFIFYKFRSMYTHLSTGEKYGGGEAEALLTKLRTESNEADGPMFKMANDPRITPVGRFIRRTSLDELPQLFNVLNGEMSLVGPRPALPEEVAQYSSEVKRRLLVKPGITGLWQVSGRNEVSFLEYVQMDTYYIERWSILFDIKIILLTVRAIFARTGK